MMKRMALGIVGLAFVTGIAAGCACNKEAKLPPGDMARIEAAAGKAEAAAGKATAAAKTAADAASRADAAAQKAEAAFSKSVLK